MAAAGRSTVLAKWVLLLLLLLLQAMLNPFHTPSTTITSKVFDQKVRLLARRMLG
jgi:hypothetical protein